MPNIKNISAPIVLISAGRSGTTLFSDIFDRHPDFSACGETTDLIFDLWNAGQRSMSHIAAASLKGSNSSIDGHVAKFVRDGFLSLLEDEKPLWFQKPIGIPFALSHASLDPDLWDEMAAQYWRVMRNTFPDAKYFTVLRHPCDVVMSYKNRFGFEEQQCWAVLGFISHILCHADSPVQYAVSYNALVQDGEASLRSLLAFLGVAFHSDMLAAFETMHSLNAATESSCGSDFTWQSQWAALDPSLVHERQLDAIEKLYRKFGHELALPPRFADRIGLTSAALAVHGNIDANIEPISDTNCDVTAMDVIAKLARADSATTDQMRAYIRQLETQIDKNNLLWEDRAIRQDNELFQAYLKLENSQRQAYLSLTAQIDDLTTGKAWLDEQCKSWQQLANQRESMLVDTERHFAEIEQGNIWLEGQVAAWRAAARELEIRIDTISRNPILRISRLFRHMMRAKWQWARISKSS
jgi:hypothetical protein